MLLVLLVDATEVDESESDDESDPSSESDEEDDDDEDDSGDLPGGFESTGFVFTVVILLLSASKDSPFFLRDPSNDSRLTT